MPRTGGAVVARGNPRLWVRIPTLAGSVHLDGLNAENWGGSRGPRYIQGWGSNPDSGGKCHLDGLKAENWGGSRGPR